MIYVNDISSAVRSHIQMFADDSTLYRVVSSFEDCKYIASKEKCELLCISNKRLPLNICLVTFSYAGVLQLDIWECILVLLCHGMIIVPKLLPKLQGFLIFFIVICMHGCTKHLKYKYVRAFALPILDHEYACQAWNPHTQKCIRKTTIQCRGDRLICGAQFNSSKFTWTHSSYNFKVASTCR